MWTLAQRAAESHDAAGGVERNVAWGGVKGGVKGKASPNGGTGPAYCIRCGARA